MAPPVDPKIVSKIKKCLALSKSSESHEAAAALRQAQKMMQLHNLDEATVELGAIDEEEVRSTTTATRIKGWEGQLAHIIKTAFGVGLLFTKAYPYGRFTFVGPKSDVLIAKYTFVYLRRLCTAGRRDYLENLKRVEKQLGGWMGRSELTNRADSYAMGWVDVVSTKIETFARPPAQAALIERRVQDASGGRTSKHRSQPEYYGALAKGQEDGRKVSIHRPMETGSNDVPKKLGVI